MVVRDPLIRRPDRLKQVLEDSVIVAQHDQQAGQKQLRIDPLLGVAGVQVAVQPFVLSGRPQQPSGRVHFSWRCRSAAASAAGPPAPAR